MRFALLGTWGAIYAVTLEIYPTGLRASEMGTAGAVARIGGLLATSIIGTVLATNFVLALAVISGVLAAAAAAVCVWLVDVESKTLTLE